MLFISFRSALIYCIYIKIVLSFIIVTFFGAKMTLKLLIKWQTPMCTWFFRNYTYFVNLIQVSSCSLKLELTQVPLIQGEIHCSPQDVHRCTENYPSHVCIHCSSLIFLIALRKNHIWLSLSQISVHFWY